MDYKIIDFTIRGDERGSLIAVEGCNEIPFDIKRVYYIFDTDTDVVRGKHAHKDLEQVVICTSGSCDFILDDGQNREIVHLDTPSKGLYIKNMVWREFRNFSSDCVIFVMASRIYDESDYIRDYQTFLNNVSLDKY